MNNTINVNYQILNFLENIDDLINNYVDKVELTPVQITKDIYATGIKRSQTSYTDIEIHLKEIRKINLEGINSSITDEGGWYMMEPDGEMWLSTAIMNEATLKLMLDKFMKAFQQLNSFYIMSTKYKDDEDKVPHIEITLFENKKVACKEALKMRKIHKNVTNKFETYNNKGEKIINTTQQQQEPTDFELITCKVE